MLVKFFDCASVCLTILFQAVCKDKIFPLVGVFAKGYGPSENPRRAYVLAYVIGLGFILIGNIR